ncbi:class I SAM-dependent methyltransferase [Actinoplanes sp. NPDC026619]|uniref:class I SAM-dependent methyltransferase n=1 Tax=Actinoplanes sp. NPDC026619 TaxID=3155798 RepID=UPI0033F33238
MSNGTEQDNLWLRMIAENPGHSKWYIQRFRDMAARGDDLAGEARMIDAMVPRGSRILDAGCGAGRVGGFLSAAGHRVTGVDLDPELIAAAGADHPGATWLVGDLAELKLEGPGFDVIVCAGNVMTFLAPATRLEVLHRFAAHLADGGRAAIGFGAGRGYEFHDFFEDAAAAGLRPEVLFSTWDLRSFRPGADFLVALLARDQ